MYELCNKCIVVNSVHVLFTKRPLATVAYTPHVVLKMGFINAVLGSTGF